MKIIYEYADEHERFKKKIRRVMSILYDVEDRWSSIDSKRRKIRHMAMGVRFAISQFSMVKLF